jgi:hypothetical protein
MRFMIPVAVLLLASCSTLPDPSSSGSLDPATGNGRRLLEKSAATHGNRWDRYSKVSVSYDGTWARLATRIQPVLTDPEFRKSSNETYFPGSGRVIQEHSGPAGTKSVRRTRNVVQVRYNGEPTTDAEQLDAAALVADAYAAFLFGPSWLLAEGKGFRHIASKNLDGETCDLIAATLRPGFGRSDEDQVIAWISRESGLMRRLQFTLNGLESTRGADVDVVFSGMKKVADGSVWPTRFLERVQRPLSIKAHEWQLTRLATDGRKAL